MDDPAARQPKRFDAREVWYGTSFAARASRAALTPCSWLYAGGWQAYLSLYRLGIKRAAEPHRPIVCVGNLMVGGTGKSPLTVYLAELIRRSGRKVALSASGYGGPHAEAATIAPDGPLSAQEWGDEPAMLRWLLPDIPLIVGRRRVLAAELCHRRFADHVLLMDDGFQHLPLRKQVTVVIDPEVPRNRRCLPAGPYREPRGNRRRASIVLPGTDWAIGEKRWFEEGGQTVDAPSAFSVICALGQPDRFLDSLPRGASVVRTLPDHDPLTAGTLLNDLPRDLPVVVTAKDWVKLRERPDCSQRRFIVCRQAVSVEPEERFLAWLERKLHEFETTPSTKKSVL